MCSVDSTTTTATTMPPAQPSKADTDRFLADLERMAPILSHMGVEATAEFIWAMIQRAQALGLSDDIFPEQLRSFVVAQRQPQPQQQQQQTPLSPPRPQVSFLPQVQLWLGGEERETTPEPVCTCPICYSELDIKGISPLVPGEYGKEGEAYDCGHMVCDDCHDSLVTHRVDPLTPFSCPVCRQASEAFVCRHPIANMLPGNGPMWASNEWNILDRTVWFKSFCEGCLMQQEDEDLNSRRDRITLAAFLDAQQHFTDAAGTINFGDPIDFGNGADADAIEFDADDFDDYDRRHRE